MILLHYKVWNIYEVKEIFSFKITSNVADQRTNDYLTHSGKVTR